jgi:hypothetical protein
MKAKTFRRMRSGSKRSRTMRTKRSRRTRRKMRGGRIINYLTKYPESEKLDNDVARFFIKNESNPNEYFVFSKEKTEGITGLKALKSHISYDDFLKLAESERNIAKLYRLSPSGYMYLDENIVDNMLIIKPNKYGDTWHTYETYVFKNTDYDVEWIVIDTNNSMINEKYPDSELTELINTVEFKKMAEPTRQTPEYVLARSGPERTNYPFAGEEGGSKRKRISKHRRTRRSSTKRRTRGGGGGEPTPNEELKLKLYKPYIKINPSLSYKELMKYKVKFIQKIEPKATATIKSKEVANNTDNAVYIVQVLSTEVDNFNWRDIVNIYSQFSELFPNKLVNPYELYAPGKPYPSKSEIEQSASELAILQAKISANDYFPVFPGHNLKLFRKTNFLSKDETIVSPLHDEKSIYTPAEIQFFTDFYGLASSQEEPAGFLNPEDDVNP